MRVLSGADLRRGIRLGVDVGSVRIGVARSDPDGLLAVPETTVARGAGDLLALGRLVSEAEAIEVVVGLPVRMDGTSGPAAQAARDFARELAATIAPVPVRLVDERLTTVQAHRGLREAGGRTRTERGRREVVDRSAAAILLQHALDTERGTGHPPGDVVASALTPSSVTPAAPQTPATPETPGQKDV